MKDKRHVSIDGMDSPFDLVGIKSAKVIKRLAMLRSKLPGVGLLTATALVGFVGDIQRFRSSRQFGVIARFVPEITLRKKNGLTWGSVQCSRSLSGIGSLEPRINNLRAIPGL